MTIPVPTKYLYYGGTGEGARAHADLQLMPSLHTELRSVSGYQTCQSSHICTYMQTIEIDNSSSRAPETPGTFTPPQPGY